MTPLASILAILLLLLLIASSIASLVCLIIVLVKMFQNNETTLGVVCLVTTFFCGIGPFLTFIFGWINVAKWNIQRIMIIWTCCFVANLLLFFIIMLGWLLWSDAGDMQRCPIAIPQSVQHFNR